MKTIVTTMLVLCIGFAQNNSSGGTFKTAKVLSVASDGKSGTMEIDQTGERGTFEVRNPKIHVILGDIIQAARRGNTRVCTVVHWMVTGAWSGCPPSNENCGLFGLEIVCNDSM